jgi:hypothetical protein
VHGIIQYLRENNQARILNDQFLPQNPQKTCQCNQANEVSNVQSETYWTRGIIELVMKKDN